MSEPTTYQTAGGSTITLGFRHGMYGPVHFFECDGCGGVCGRKTAEAAANEARKHATRCTAKPAEGGA